MECLQCNIEMVCVEDFCGNSTKGGTFKHQINFWADWCPCCKMIKFGGFWGDIPPIFSEYEPDFDNLTNEIKSHISLHEPVCEENYWNYINREG